MSKVYKTWEEMTRLLPAGASQKAFWDDYFKEETDVYRTILKELADDDGPFTGTEAEVAEHYGMAPEVFANFIDGINTSLETPYDLESLEDTTPIEWVIIPEKLYYNMLDAKAKHLYSLSEWDAVLSEEKRKQIAKDWRESKQAIAVKRPGRNDPCHCGSGKKYKKCCMQKDLEAAADA